MKEQKEVKVEQNDRKQKIFSFYQENADMIRLEAEQKKKEDEKADNKEKVISYHDHVCYSI